MRCRQCCTSSGGSMRESALCLFQLLVAVGMPWSVDTSLSNWPLPSHCFPVSVSFPLTVTNLPLLSLIRILVRKFRVNQYKPGWSFQQKILNLITSAMTLFPNKLTFTGFRDQNWDMSFGEPLFNLLHMETQSHFRFIYISGNTVKILVHQDVYTFPMS